MTDSGEAPSLFAALGSEEGCLRLSTAFYARVAVDPILRPLFPGKSLRCAREEFSAFLIQFFGGDEERTQYRWWLSLRESHSRFDLEEAHRAAWVERMRETLASEALGKDTEEALSEFFLQASLYILGGDPGLPKHPELEALWERQLALDEVIRILSERADEAAVTRAEALMDRPSLMVGILARMMDAGRHELLAYVLQTITRTDAFRRARFNGRSLLHFASGQGTSAAVRALLDQGIDPNLQDSGGHSPLYRAASHRDPDECSAILHELIAAGADVDHSGGATRATPLHEAVRRSNVAAVRTLLFSGADRHRRDRQGSTPYDRALRRNNPEVMALFGIANG